MILSTCRRARIASIAETWKENSDYTSLRALAKQKTISRDEDRGDFLFIINDKTTYHHLSDFKSSRARSLFSQALGLESQLKALKEELSVKRDQYAGGNSANETLDRSILALEKDTESLFLEIERLQWQSRNEEIGTIFN
jgi:hypothetical protein